MSGDAQSLLSDSHDESGVFADSIDLIPRIERSELIRPHDRYIIDELDAAAVTAVQSGIKPQRLSGNDSLDPQGLMATAKSVTVRLFGETPSSGATAVGVNSWPGWKSLPDSV